MACIGVGQVEAEKADLVERLHHYLSDMRPIEQQIDCESAVLDLVGNVGELDQPIPSLASRCLPVDRGRDVVPFFVVGPVAEQEQERERVLAPQPT